jgi:hypothetical protein
VLSLAGGKLTWYEVVNGSLPRPTGADDPEPKAGHESSSQVQLRLKPAHVGNWDEYEGVPLKEAVITYQQSADNVSRRQVVCAVKNS